MDQKINEEILQGLKELRASCLANAELADRLINKLEGSAVKIEVKGLSAEQKALYRSERLNNKKPPRKGR